MRQVALFVVITFSVMAHCGAGKKCMKNWMRLGSVCYHVEGTKTLTWEEARIFCRSHGGMLAEPVSPKENAMIVEYLLAFFGCQYTFWLGMRRGMGNTFHFQSNGHIVSYSDWNPGQPDNDRNAENCGEYRCIRETRHRWNDLPCSSKLPFICQEKETAAPMTTMTMKTTQPLSAPVTDSPKEYFNVTTSTTSSTQSLTPNVTYAEPRGLSPALLASSVMIAPLLLALSIQWMR